AASPKLASPSVPAQVVPAAAPGALAPPASATGRVPPAVPAVSLQADSVAINASRASHHYVIAAIGDSLTDPRSHGGGYLEYLKERCPGLEIDNFGKGG